jgi:hypothetical protein
MLPEVHRETGKWLILAADDLDSAAAALEAKDEALRAADGALLDLLAFAQGYCESADEDDPAHELLPRYVGARNQVRKALGGAQ